VNRHGSPLESPVAAHRKRQQAGREGARTPVMRPCRAARSRRARPPLNPSGALPAPVPPLAAVPGSPSLVVALVSLRLHPGPRRGAVPRPCPWRRPLGARVRFAAILTRSLAALRAAASGRALAPGSASGLDATPPTGSGPGGRSLGGHPFPPSLGRGSRRTPAARPTREANPKANEVKRHDR
jgi:hypothetical protein